MIIDANVFKQNVKLNQSIITFRTLSEKKKEKKNDMIIIIKIATLSVIVIVACLYQGNLPFQRYIIFHYIKAKQMHKVQTEIVNMKIYEKKFDAVGCRRCCYHHQFGIVHKSIYRTCSITKSISFKCSSIKQKPKILAFNFSIA